MSADEESTPAPTDTPMEDEQRSNKRKASADGDLEKQTAASPKRAKLEEAEADATDPAVTTAQYTEPTTKREDGMKVEVPEGREAPHPIRERTDPSPPPPRNASETRSVSPTLSRRPSVPTPEPRQASGPGPDRGRRSVSEQEKKRGQRLFGSLLSTLSQKPGGQQQKKRQEIERRQQERAQQHRVESDKRRAEKLAKLSHVRAVEQVKFDEQVMRTRHASMLVQARSLSTKCEPKLFYLPWKLTREQEMLRTEQILDTGELVAKEAEEFHRQKQERLKKLGVAKDDFDHSNGDANGRDAEHKPAAPSTSSGSVDEKPGDAKEVNEKAALEKANHENHHDDAGFVMVENEEDTVIY